MAKQILNGIESLKLIKNGVDKIANAVKITLGPKGRNVILERPHTTPLITNDGVTIAKNIELENCFENLGASIVKQASIKTNDVAGDGTTSALVLTQGIISRGYEQIKNGSNPVILKNGILKASENIVKTLQSFSTKIDDDNKIFQIASISAGDQTIGKLISQAFEKVGRQGIITVQENKTMNTELKIVEGMQFDRGYLSPYMVTDNQKMVCNLSSPYILTTDIKLNNITQLLPILQQVNEKGENLLIICTDIDNELLNTLIVNKLRGLINITIVKAPSFGQEQISYLKDISAVCNSQFITDTLGIKMNDITLDHLGRADKVIIDNNSTTISTKNNSDQLQNRINSIKTQIENCSDNFEKSKLEKRLAKLTGGIGVIMLGGATEIELQEKKLRIEDAIEATKSALQEGIICGGGISLIKCINDLDKLIETLDGDQKIGADIVKQSLTDPIITITNNAGKNSEQILKNILSSKQSNYGYDALNDCYGDMLEMGIIDPTRVTRSVVQTACSISSTLLTSYCLVCDNDK